MNPITDVRDRLNRANLDVLVAVVGAVLGLALLPLQLFSSQIFIVTLPIILLVGSVLYLAAARRNSVRTDHFRLSPTTVRVLTGTVFLGLGAMVVLATLQNERSLLFLDVAGLVGGLLVAQVLLADDRALRPGVYLSEVVLFALVLRFGALYTTPGFIGIDIWTHTTFVERILRQDTLAAIADSKYYAAPLFHMVTIASVRLLETSIRNGLYLSLGLAMVIAPPLFVYASTRLFVPLRWALLSATLYALGDQVIRWGIHLIPSSLGLLFFLACLYSLLRITHASDRWRSFGLLALFSVATIVTHQISSFIMLVLLISGLAAQFLMRFDFFTTDSEPLAFSSGAADPANLVGLAAFDFGFILFTWSLTPYKGDTFLETVLNYFYINLLQAGFLRDVSSGSGGATASGQAANQQFLAQVSTYVTEMGFLLLIFAGFVGCLALLNRSRAEHSTYAIVLAITAMLFVVLGLPLFGIENFVPGRWIAFIYALLSIVGVLGLRHVTNRTPRVVAALLLLVFVLVYPNVMVLSNDGAMDSPAFPSQHERLSYNEQELAALEAMDDARLRAVSDGELYTDDPYGTVWERTETHPAEPLPARDGTVVTQDLTVYRAYQSESASYFERAGEEGMAVDLDPSRSEVCPSTANHIYANGDVTTCTLPG